MINNSAADCSISLKFGPEFDHATSTTNVRGYGVRGQGHSVKRRLIAKLLLAESNGDVRILIGCCQVAVHVQCVHAQYKIGQNQPRTTGATSGGLQVAMHSQLPRLRVLYLYSF